MKSTFRHLLIVFVLIFLAIPSIASAQDVGAASTDDTVIPCNGSTIGCWATIVVEKQIDSAPTKNFKFKGPGSYKYSLTDNGTKAFLVKPGKSYKIEEYKTDGYQLSSIVCTTTNGTATIKVKASSRRAEIKAPTPGSSTKCVFTNIPKPKDDDDDDDDDLASANADAALTPEEAALAPSESDVFVMSYLPLMFASSK